MQAAIYYLSLPFLYLASLLPPVLMYALSDFTRFVIYKLVGYRKQVVLTNMTESFPDKSPQEIRAMCDGFYVYFFDMIFETLKTLTMSPKYVLRHIAYREKGVLEKFAKQGRSVIVAMGHIGNWEMASARLCLEPGIHDIKAIYKPLRNPYFDRLLLHMRTRNGTGMYKMKRSFANMYRDRDKLTAVLFLADQTPAGQREYWTTFLNQDTSMFTGMEYTAKKLDRPVVFMAPRRVGRGHYELVIDILADDPKQCSENTIIDRYVERLEREIRLYPESWLWTHKRWKRTRAMALAESLQP